MGWLSHYNNADSMESKDRDVLRRAYAAIDAELCAERNLEWASLIVVVGAILSDRKSTSSLPASNGEGMFARLMQSEFHRAFERRNVKVASFLNA